MMHIIRSHAAAAAAAAAAYCGLLLGIGCLVELWLLPVQVLLVRLVVLLLLGSWSHGAAGDASEIKRSRSDEPLPDC